MSLTTEQFRDIIENKLAKIVVEAATNQDPGKVLTEQFPGYKEARDAAIDSKQIVTNTIVGAQIVASEMLAKSKDEYNENVNRLIAINQSPAKTVYLTTLRAAFMIGFELGFLTSTIAAVEDKGNDEFAEFMKKLGMEDTSGGGMMQ